MTARDDLRHQVATALVDVTNRWIQPNFPAGHKLRRFDELGEQERQLNLDYADAAIATVIAFQAIGEYLALLEDDV